MSNPDWEPARRHLASGKGGLREFRKLVANPIIQSLDLLSVVLVGHPLERIKDAQRSSHHDEQLVRMGLLDMIKAGALPGLVVHDHEGQVLGPTPYSGPPPPFSIGRIKRSAPPRRQSGSPVSSPPLIRTRSSTQKPPPEMVPVPFSPAPNNDSDECMLEKLLVSNDIEVGCRVKGSNPPTHPPTHPPPSWTITTTTTMCVYARMPVCMCACL